jgi:hypothetical protein
VAGGGGFRRHFHAIAVAGRSDTPSEVINYDLPKTDDKTLEPPSPVWHDGDMPWILPLYGRSKVNWAGQILVTQPASDDDRDKSLMIVNNWRSAHAYPSFAFNITLRNRARKIYSSATVVRRIKRLASIEKKLKRFSNMTLSQMQDIGGCRAVVLTVAQVRAVRNLYLGRRHRRLQHEFVKEYDYIAQPQDSGYRAIHLVYKYMSDKPNQVAYCRQRIEIQLRSRPQHAWAAAVETVDAFTRQSLKASQGSKAWLRFFALMGSAIARREGAVLVPDTPTDENELKSELRRVAADLKVEENLASYTTAVQLPTHAELKGAKYYILELRTDEKKLYVTAYRGKDLGRATEFYLEVERNLKPGAQAVLVSGESLLSIQRAYPNYFVDTQFFVDTLREVIA